MRMSDKETEERYSRQAALGWIGGEGQRRLSSSRVAVVGLGATGSVSSMILVRAGVAFIRVIDRDIVEVSNLQRQLLYTDSDAADGLPKAVAAANNLGAMNPGVQVEAVNDHLSPRNIAGLVGDVDIVIDGTDNMETRYLINDYCVRGSVPWIYGGAIGSGGMAMLIIPGAGACLRCLFPEVPGPEKLGTCETAGVLGPAPSIVGSYQAAAAIRCLVGGKKTQVGHLLTFDLRYDSFSVVRVERDPQCPACARGEFPYLEEEIKTTVVTTCGEGSYQVYPPAPRSIDLPARAESLKERGEVLLTGHYLSLKVGSRTIIIFSDGRARLKGMDGPAEALNFYSRYVGM